MSIAHARACANIALAKYWGKSDKASNLTAVPSLSLTLRELTTTTTVEFVTDVPEDVVRLDGAEVQRNTRPAQRVSTLLDRVRAETGETRRARVTTANQFPTAAGLASSASGFAALAVAARAAAGAPFDLAKASRLARASSASAARSVYGGYVSLAAGSETAERVLAEDPFGASMVIALTESGPKSIGSTEGMLHTERTSPYYAAWVEHAPRVFEAVLTALRAGEFDALGAAMEHSTLMMHASMMAAAPAVVYLAPATLAVLREVKAARPDIPAYFTMDAGPHVKVLTRSRHADALRARLQAVPGVRATMVSGVGGDAELLDVPPTNLEG